MNPDADVHDPRSGRSMGARELQAAHEIAQAFLAATRPIEIYRLALGRVTPMVGADFAAVFLRDDRDSELLRPVCLHGWPQQSARFLGQLRIRVGMGPTGRAVAENSSVEVTDIFADASLRDWHDAASELGFSSLITLPLATQTAVNGAVSFYFATAHEFNDDERGLLRLISEQLAATTTRARVLDDLRIENERLRRDGEHLAAAIREAELDARGHDGLVASVLAELGQSLRESTGTPAESHDALGDVVDNLSELLDLRLGRTRFDIAPGDALRLARTAADCAGGPQKGADFTIIANDSIVALATDGPRVVRILSTILREAFRRTARGSVILSVDATEDDAGSWVEWSVTARGMGVDDERANGSDLRPGTAKLVNVLAIATAEALGGWMAEDAEPINGWCRRLRLPVRGTNSATPPVVRSARG